MTVSGEKREVKISVGQLTKEGVYIGRFKNENGEEKDWFANVDDARDKKGGRLKRLFSALLKHTRGAKNKEGRRLKLAFADAVEYADYSNDLDRKDWILPPGPHDPLGRPDILGALFSIKDLFNNRSDGVCGFVETGPKPADCYASSSPCYVEYTDVQSFCTGKQYLVKKIDALPVRLVRSLDV